MDQLAFDDDLIQSKYCFYGNESLYRELSIFMYVLWCIKTYAGKKNSLIKKRIKP